MKENQTKQEATNGSIEFSVKSLDPETRTNSEKTDLVVADPPREGLGKKLSEIVCDSTRNVVYIACEPPNLVRDLKTFFEKGFHVKHLFILDLFPDTPHFETVCILSKSQF